MAKPTNEELQKELEDVVNKHNQAVELVSQCKLRATEITAILKDRAADEEPVEEVTPETV
tara:strand:- start:694 stop:873 length:180 start_codon:yes stop_codon:yes gene_type:complete